MATAGALLVSLMSVAFVLAILIWSKRCDDSCISAVYAQSWKERPDSWQWTGQMVVALAAWIAAATTVARAARGGAIGGASIASIALLALWLLAFRPL